MTYTLLFLSFSPAEGQIQQNTCPSAEIQENLMQGIEREQWADDVFFGKAENPPVFFQKSKIKRAYRTAASHYQVACDCGSATACHNLGWQYKYGKGLVADYEQAAVYFKLACDGGEPYGCTNLGYLYYIGRGYEHNEAKAKELFDKACSLGLEPACEWE